MLRFSAAFVMGFVLIVVEAMIVMKIKNYTSIYFGSIEQLVGVYMMNFFLVFVILTDIKRWIEKREEAKAQMEG